MTVLEVCFVLICVYKCVPVLTFPSPLSLSNADGESRHDDGASAQRVLFYPLPVVVEASEVDNVLSKNPDELQQMLLEKQSDNALLPLNLPDNIIQKITDILKHPITMDLDTDAENSLGSVNAGNLFVSSTSESPESVTFFTDELHDERVSSVSVPVPVSVSREMEAPTSVSQTTTESTYVPSYVTKIPTPTHQDTIKPPVKLLKRLLSDYLPVVNPDVRDSKRPEKNSVISSLASKRLKTAPSMKYPVFGDGQFMSLLNTLNVILNRKVLPPSETYEPFKAPTYNVSFPHFTVNVSETMFESPVIDHHTPAPKATTSSNFWSTVVTQSPSPPRSQNDSTPTSHTIKYISQSTVSPFNESHPLSVSWTTISKSPSTLTSSISPIPSQNAVSQTEKTSSVVDMNPETSFVNTPITGPPYESKPDNDGLEHLSTASVKAWSSTFSPLLQHSDNFQIDDKIGIFSSSEPLSSIYQHEITHSNNYNLIDGADTTSPPTDSYPTFSSASLDNEQDTGTYHTTEEEVKTTSPESYFESTPDQDETSSPESYPYESTQNQDETSSPETYSYESTPNQDKTSSPETFSYESTQTQDETLSTESYLHESTQNQDEASSDSYPYESTQNQEEDASEIFAINTHSTDVDCVSHTTQLLSTLSYEGETDTTQHSEQSLLLETTEISTFTDAVTTDEYHEDSDCDGDKESDTTQELSSTLIFEGETTETSTSIDAVTTEENHEDSDCDGDKVSDTTQEHSSTLIFEGETTETSTFTDAVTTDEYHEDSDCDGDKESDTTQELSSTLIFEGETTETSTSIDAVTTEENHEDSDCDGDKVSDTTQEHSSTLIFESETTETLTFADAVPTDEYHEDIDCDGDKESDTAQELSSTLIFEGETTKTSTSIDAVTTDEYHEDSDCDGDKESDTTQELSSTLIFEGETTETSTFTDAVTKEEYHEDSDCDGEKVSGTTQELSSTLIFEGETTETSTFTDAMTTEEYHEDSDCDGEKVSDTTQELFSTLIFEGETDTAEHSEQSSLPETTETSFSIDDVTTDEYHEDIDCDDDKIHFDKKVNRELVSDDINTLANPTDNQTESDAEKYEESSKDGASVKTTQIYHQPTTESESHPDIVYGSSQPTIFDDTETTTVSVSEGEPQSLFLDVKPVSEDIDEEPMTPFSLATSSVRSTGNKVNAETATVVMISTGDDEEEEIDDPLNCDTSNSSTSAVNEEVTTSTLDQKPDLTTEGQVSETSTLSLSDSSETATKSFDNEDLPISEDLNEIGDEQDSFRRGKNSKQTEESSSDDEHWSDDDQHSTVNSSNIDYTEKIGFQTGDSDTKTKDLINSEILRKRSENFPNLEEEPISSENFEDGLDETYDPPKIEQKKIPDELKEIQASESMVISSETSAEKLMSLLSKQLDNEGVESEEEDGDYEIDGAGMKIVKNGQRKGKWIEDLSNDELVALMESMKSRNS